MAEIGELLERARAAGFVVQTSGGTLIVRGPRRLQALAHKLLENKAEIFRALQDERRRQYAMLTADIATDEDCEALRWLTDHGRESVLSELLAADARCHALIRAAAAEAEVRTAVETFVARVREMRELFGRETETQ